MNLELAVQIATLVTLLLTAGALIFSMCSFRKQMNWQVYLACTERHEKILGSFPAGALRSRLRLSESLPPKSEELGICILKYLNLCSEEFFLYQNGFVSRKIWSIWRPEIERAIRTPMLRREWERIRNEFQSYPEFLDFVEKIQKEGPPRTN